MWNVSWRFRLGKIFRGYDIIHFHNTHSYAITHYGVLAAKKLGKQVVWTPHDYWFACPMQTMMRDEAVECDLSTCDTSCMSKGYRGKILASRHKATSILKSVDLVLPPSDYVATKVVALGIPPDRVKTIHNGVQIPINIPPHNVGKNSLFIGRLDVWKGVKVLADAFVLVAQSNPDVKFNIVGDGPERQWLVANLPKDRAVLHGKVAQDALEAQYSKADLVVVPSIWPEPFGLVAAEAMARARPVVAARSGALPEIIEDGKTGLLVPPNDPKALAEAMMKVILDPAIAQKMGTHGREVAIRKFSIEDYGKRVEAAYGALKSS
jgi:glycosyltransferase involved in cell wall biosynthesis